MSVFFFDRNLDQHFFDVQFFVIDGGFFRRSSTLSSVKTNMSVLPFLTGFLDYDIFKQHVTLHPLLTFRLILLINTHAPSAVSAFSNSNRFRVFVWTSENDLKTLRACGHEFFWKTEKKVAFSNENGYVWTGP